jgi:hypothetical protein
MKVPKKAARPTDKQRFDWLELNKHETEFWGRGMWSIWDGDNFSESTKGLRQAIDSAMRAATKPGAK